MVVLQWMLLWTIFAWIRFDDESQEDLSGCGVYVDPEYNVLWSYSALENRMSCFNSIATNIERLFGHRIVTLLVRLHLL